MEIHRSERRGKYLMIFEERAKNCVDEQQCDGTAPLITRLSEPIVLELPDHVLCDIFSRLPLKSIFHCSRVCKMFLQLVKDSCFIELHRARSSVLTTNLIFQHSLGQLSTRRLFTFNHEEPPLSFCTCDDQNKHYCCHHGLYTWNISVFTFHTRRHVLVGSCDGLLCLYFDSSPKPFYAICNPIRREQIKLPCLAISTPFNTYANYSGFGYCRKTKQYKVISLMYLISIDPLTSEESKRLVADVHTLGSDSWRRIENAPWPKRKSFDPLLNDALHWITTSCKPCELISSFDLAAETFKFVPPPAHFSLQYIDKISSINIGVLKNCLCICYIYKDTVFEVWLMKEYGVKESWTRQFRIDMKTYTELSIEDLQRPIKFLNNGDLWFISGSEFLVSFSPAKRTFKELRPIGPEKSEIIAHNLSFISPKDVAGANAQN
ncbi:F-box protein At3g07870-like [Primulina eburnea]|uniref:F-box protein At3g07870-like n=1 Tax=Primulina eburnea TaxID=1245227 RepID=UPI003C6BFF1E